MQPYLKQLVMDLLQLLPVLLLSALGGAVAYLNKPKSEFSWWFLLIGIITAGFVGLVVHFLLQSTSWPAGVQASAVAISGYASRDVLFLLKARLLRTVKKEVS